MPLSIAPLTALGCVAGGDGDSGVEQVTCPLMNNGILSVLTAPTSDEWIHAIRELAHRLGDRVNERLHIHVDEATAVVSVELLHDDN